MTSIRQFPFVYYTEKAIFIQFVECLSVNRGRENKEIHLNEFGYCLRCAGNSPWAEISVETLVIVY